MKYTIEGFSQEKLLEYKLNVIDALILRWFLDFAACGKMKRLVQENEEHVKNVYYWVDYQAILDEFPAMDISNTKSIQNRFNKYVEIGLLDKIVHSGGSNGLQSFFAITEKCLELEYSTIPAAKKIKEKEEKIKNNSEKNSSKICENINCKNNNEKKCNLGFSNGNDDCFKYSPKNEYLFKKTNNENNSENKTTIQNSSDNLSECIEKDTSESIHGVESKFQSAAEWNLNSSPEAGQESKFQSGVESKFQSVYINSSTKNSSTTLSNPSSTERAEILTKAVKEHFEGSLALFSDDLIPKLVSLTSEIELKNLPHYIKYVFLLVKSQKPNKPQGMFYKFVLQKNTLDAFVTSLSGSGKAYRTWTCPICHNKNSIVEDCPVCDCEYHLRNDEKHLFIKKQLFELSEGRRKMFKEEVSQLASSGNYENYRKNVHLIYKKYGIKEEIECQK